MKTALKTGEGGGLDLTHARARGLSVPLAGVLLWAGAQTPAHTTNSESEHKKAGGL